MGDGGFAGLVITSLSRAEFSGKQSLHVWIAHNEGAADVIEAGLEMLKQTARKAGIPAITFGSPRLGWSKRFKLLSATYEVDVQ